jgi:hypothetical protein
MNSPENGLADRIDRAAIERARVQTVIVPDEDHSIPCPRGIWWALMRHGLRLETPNMIVIRFPDDATERRALGFLAGRFGFTTWKSGETLVPETALSALAVEGISFLVHGPANYGQAIPTIRDTTPAPV